MLPNSVFSLERGARIKLLIALNQNLLILAYWQGNSCFSKSGVSWLHGLQLKCFFPTTKFGFLRLSFI